jgi:hypothetical protein
MDICIELTHLVYREERDSSLMKKSLFTKALRRINVNSCVAFIFFSFPSSFSNPLSDFVAGMMMMITIYFYFLGRRTKKLWLHFLFWG